MRRIINYHVHMLHVQADGQAQLLRANCLVVQKYGCRTVPEMPHCKQQHTYLDVSGQKA